MIFLSFTPMVGSTPLRTQVDVTTSNYDITTSPHSSYLGSLVKKIFNGFVSSGSGSESVGALTSGSDEALSTGLPSSRTESQRLSSHNLNLQDLAQLRLQITLETYKKLVSTRLHFTS